VSVTRAVDVVAHEAEHERVRKRVVEYDAAAFQYRDETQQAIESTSTGARTDNCASTGGT